MTSDDSDPGPGRPEAQARLGRAALKAKYREEREKRLRDDANSQYLELDGVYSHFDHDPWVERDIERAPVAEEVDVVLIGGGFGGLLLVLASREF